MLMSPGPAEIWVTGASVVVAMALTGAVSAKLGQFPVVRSMTRNVVGGLLAMAVTYGVGNLVGGSL
jgi:VIT1/CCC1 family predicted Fe2+/Mn2+ transporter